VKVRVRGGRDASQRAMGLDLKVKGKVAVGGERARCLSLCVGVEWDEAEA
jgi:hypothetical protein